MRARCPRLHLLNLHSMFFATAFVLLHSAVAYLHVLSGNVSACHNHQSQLHLLDLLLCANCYVFTYVCIRVCAYYRKYVNGDWMCFVCTSSSFYHFLERLGRLPRAPTLFDAVRVQNEFLVFISAWRVVLGPFRASSKFSSNVFITFMISEPLIT